MTTRRTTGGFTLGGSVGLLLLLPPLVYYMWICLRDNGGALIVPTSRAEWLALVQKVPLPTVTAVAIYLGWFLYHVLMQQYAPGKWVEGTALADGSRLKYKMNGWFTWWFTWVLIVAGVALGWIPPTILVDQFGPLMTVVTIFASVLSLYLFVYGRRHPKGEEVSGDFLYDYFMGTSLNPRIGTFDWKLFCEARPGLIGWIAINLSLAAKQYQLHGFVSTPMIMVNLFQFWYVADYYFHEEAILTTWDIKHENFGWMLCWGDLLWVPFTYTIQAWYLLNHTHSLPIWAIVGITALNAAGFIVFRGTNIQKHNFRKDPTRPVWGKKPEYLKTKTGSLLLTSGWWGQARHINYLGDLMMGLAWCLPCGFQHVLPYFYIIYFTSLLVHRERRDHAMCAAKYGSDWDTYCEKVRWRIVPGVY